MGKMLVLDLDGTSITDTYSLPNELHSLVYDISKKHLVYIATGRSISDAYVYYKALGLKNDLICHNGGLICNPNSGSIKYQKNILNAPNIIEFILENKESYMINNVVLSKCNETYLLTKENEYLLEIMVNRELPFFYVGNKLSQIFDVQRIIISVEPCFREELQNRIMDLFDEIIICGWKGREDIIDISVGGVNKWNAVQYIAKIHNIIPENIISFGDALNDIELLKNSGIGICMLNGTTETKNAADFVTNYDNNKNGVYDFIVNELSSVF